jgi:hypothetical protein
MLFSLNKMMKSYPTRISNLSMKMTNKNQHSLLQTNFKLVLTNNQTTKPKNVHSYSDSVITRKFNTHMISNSLVIVTGRCELV